MMTYSRAHAREKKGQEINGKGREQVEILSTLAGRGGEGLYATCEDGNCCL